MRYLKFIWAIIFKVLIVFFFDINEYLFSQQAWIKDIAYLCPFRPQRNPQMELGCQNTLTTITVLQYYLRKGGQINFVKYFYDQETPFGSVCMPPVFYIR